MLIKHRDWIRFLNYFTQTNEDSCWDWKGTINPGGYGRFHCDGKQHQAHRISFIKLRGKIKKGLQLDHLCRNRRCVNPYHLEEVTQRENILRGNGATAINARKTHDKYGHEFDFTRDGFRRCSICVKRDYKYWMSLKKHPKSYYKNYNKNYYEKNKIELLRKQKEYLKRTVEHGIKVVGRE